MDDPVYQSMSLRKQREHRKQKRKAKERARPVFDQTHPMNPSRLSQKDLTAAKAKVSKPMSFKRAPLPPPPRR